MRFLGVFSADYDKKFVLPELRETMAKFGVYEHFDCERSSPPPADELVSRIAAADVILTGWSTPKLPEAILAAPGRKLRYVCHIAGQVSPFMTRKFIESGVLVTNWGDEGVWTFAEGTVALIFGCLKDMHRIGPYMRKGKWEFAYTKPSPTLRDKTVGLIGFGAIARTVVEMLRPLACRFIVFDPFMGNWGQSPNSGDSPRTSPRTSRDAQASGAAAPVARCAALDDIFAQADIVSVHCGLTPQTTGMIGAKQLDKLRPHAIFVNTSRGKVVREAELVEFLRRRPDVSAGLDVYETEPLPPDSPLRKLDNVICYPHCVGRGGEVFDRILSGVAARNIEAFCTHKPMQYVITPEQYDRMT